MPALRVDALQRFTCHGCTRCCRRWEIVVTDEEHEAYRQADAARLFRETDDGPEGTERDPFEPIAGPGRPWRIRKRPGGACGFLAPAGRCRLHETLGAERKPLACQVFPFRVHPAAASPVTVSLSCPTVVRGEGEPLGLQVKELARLRSRWHHVHPEPAATELAFVAGRTVDPQVAGTLRRVLRTMLDRRSDDRLALADSVARMGHWLDDLTRLRVVRLAPDRFAEYVELTGNYAAGAQKPSPARRPSWLARLYLRGLLLLSVSAREQVDGTSWGLRLRLLALTAHLHGVGPAACGFDLRAARSARLGVDDPALQPILHNALRGAIEGLGTGRRPLVAELAVAVALLCAALVLARSQAGRAGLPQVTPDHLVAAINETADLGHVDPRSTAASLLGTFSADVEALFLFAAGAPL